MGIGVTARAVALLFLTMGGTLAPSVGLATSFDVLQQRSWVFDATDTDHEAIKGKTTYWNGSSQRSSTLYAGGFQLKKRETGTTESYTDFLAFCVEITASLRTSSNSVVTYETAPDLYDPLRRSLVATLFQEVYDPTGSVTHQGAFQLALWKLVHGDVSTSGGDGFDIRDTSTLTNGVLSFTKRANGRALSNTFDDRTPGVFDLAQGWLDMLDGIGSDWVLLGNVEDHVTFLTNDRSQNLVTAAQTVVPLPPAVVLSGAAIAALGMLRILRRSDQVS